MCRLIIFVSSFLVLIHFRGEAQPFSGILPDAYAGIFSADFQPAALAASGLKTDILIAGTSSAFGNNYVDIQRGLFFGRGWRDLSGENYQEYLREDLDGSDKFMRQDLSLHLPSVMYALSPRQALAFTARVRGIVTADGVAEPGARFAYHLLDIPEQWGQRYENDAMRFQALSYLELGLAFSRVVRSQGPHFLRLGGRVKWIEGMEGMYLYGEQLAYTFHNDSILSVYDARFQYAHSTGFEENNGAKPWKQLFKGNYGLGLDLGWVYEYRPEQAKYRGAASPYRFRLGFSLLDLGSVGFRQSASSQDFSGTVENYNLNQLEVESLADFDSALRANFDYGSGAVSFRMRLPAAVSLQLDYRLGNRFFLGFIPYWPVKGKGKPNQPQGLRTYTFLPRYETRKLGLGAPVSIQENGSLTLGLTLRAGPFVVGSRNLLNLLLSPYSQSADLHVALRIPIPAEPPSDIDQDGIPDEKDRCPEIAGVQENRGCPEPPEWVVPEPVEVRVEPVRVAGLADAALPGITFPRKRPKALPGGFQAPTPVEAPVVFVLLPIPQSIRPLPLPAAELALLRQPWPEEPEPAADPLDAYLPFADKDEDGIPNREDKCPDIPGELTNDGCPEVEEGYFREDVFQSIYFDTNEDALRPKSEQTLYLVLSYLQENPEAGVRLAGHTDNSGEDKANVDLSLDRCQSARNFLIERGIGPDRIRVFHYGETLPAASNETPEGRQLNRRVDITLFSF